MVNPPTLSPVNNQASNGTTQTGRDLWRPAISWALTVFIALRLYLSLLGGAILWFTGFAPDPATVAHYYLGQSPIGADVSGTLGGIFTFLLSPWQRWDALWYTHIAQYGYLPGDGSANLHPLYPLLVALAGRLLPGADGDKYLLAALIVSNVCLIGALAFLYRLARRESNARAARRAVRLLALSPAAFFLFAPYTESLLILCLCAAFWYGQHEKWALAATWGALAGLTKLPGVLVIVPLAWWAWQKMVYQRRQTSARQIGGREQENTIFLQKRGSPFSHLPGGVVDFIRNPAFLWLCLIPVATLTWMLYRYIFLNGAGDGTTAAGGQNTFVFPVAAQQVWAWRFVPPWEGLLRGIVMALTPAAPVQWVRSILELGMVLALGAAVPWVWRHAWRPYAIYLLVVWLALLCWVDALRPFSTVYRHSLLFFPIVIVLADNFEKRRVDDRGLALISLGLLTIFTTFFVMWYWMG
ncbi:MAG: hypothetical protein EXR62_00970 [Chloroflexi bacterium]|nr:hypothetical protein [Chloroflexota bacterium]